MLQDKKSLTGKIGDTIRLCMYLICGASQNKYKQPKFVENSAEDSIYYELTALIDAGKLNEAEDVMFDRLNPRNADDYYTMLCVYDYMNGLDDDYLEFNSHPRFPFCKRVSHFESDLQILYPTFHFCNDFPVFSLAFMI